MLRVTIPDYFDLTHREEFLIPNIFTAEINLSLMRLKNIASPETTMRCWN